MDAVARVAAYFPAQSITSFWILSNLIINNEQYCDKQTRSLVIAIIVLFCLFVVLSSFTDTYTASNNQKYIVLLVPLYGPVCMSLPTLEDKDRMYAHFYLKVRDYIRAIIAVTAFILIVLFINPIVMCLFPSDDAQSLSSISSSVVRTVPVVVAVITSLMMVCLGPPRQSLGFQNVDETCPPIEKRIENPIYSNKHEGQHPLPPRISGSQAGGYPVLDGDEDMGGDDAPAGYPGGKQMSQVAYNSAASNGFHGNPYGTMANVSVGRAPNRESFAARQTGHYQQEA